jgi:phosphate-selective porin OprO/OprP
MEVNRKALVIGGALLCGVTSVTMADSAATTDVSAQISALQSQVAAQQAQIADLKAKSDQNWLNEQRTEEVKGLIHDALADADTRASLASDNAVAGNDGKFFIKTADDSFRMNLGGVIQTRYVADLRGVKTDTAANDGHEDGFQMRRIELDVDGYIGSPKIDYAFALRFDDGGQTSNVVLANVGYKFEVGDGSIRVFGGRFYDKFSREAMMGEGNQQTVERSAVDYIFAANDDITEGAGVEWTVLPEYLKLAATFNNGTGAGSDSGNLLNPTGDDFNTTRSDYAFTGRADVKIVGDWKEEADVESWSTNPDLQAFVGGGYHYEGAKHGDANAASTVRTPLGNFSLGETSEFTIDALLKCHGFGAMGSFYGLYLNDITTGGPTSARMYGATVQAGYTIADKVEPFVRYEWISPDQGLTGGANQLNFVTVGANYFIKKHVAKFTLDTVWCLDNVNSGSTFLTPLTGAGISNDAPNRTSQVVIRAQFQLLF